MADSHSFVPILIAATALALLLIGFIVFIVVLYKKRLLSEQFETERLKTQHQRELLQQSIEVQDRERERIGKNLHDEIGINLTAARNMVVGLPASDGDEAEQVNHVKDLLRQTSEQVRQLSRELFPGTLKNLGLTEALNELCDKASLVVPCTFECLQEPEGLTKAQESSVFYIASEVINNSLKHAGATLLQVQLSYTGDYMLLEVTDNGSGFDFDASLHKKASLGMKSISGRASALDAQFGFAEKPGGGTRFHLEVPARKNSE